MSDIRKIDGVSPNDFTVGDNSASDKSLKFKKGLTNNPGIKWNNSDSKLQMTDNGTDFYNLNTGSAIGSATPKATPVDSDVFPILESTTLKKTTWSEIKATLKSYFDIIYTAIVPHFIQFNATPTVGAFSEGKVYWDSTNKALAVQTGTATTLQVGQEDWRRAINKSGADIIDGTLVYISGINSSLPTIEKAIANTNATSVVLGMTTETIANDSTGMVTIRGNVNSLNTDKIDSAYLITQGILFVSKQNGTTGNAYKVEVIDTGSAGLSYSEDATTITINLGASTSTSTQVVALFTATPSALATVTLITNFTMVIHAIESLANGKVTTEGDSLYLCPFITGYTTTVVPTIPYHEIRIGRLVAKSATVGVVNINISRAYAIDELKDVSITTPVTDQVLTYNGSGWVNQDPRSISAGVGVEFFMDDTAIVPLTAGQNVNEVCTLTGTPVTTAQVLDSKVLTGAQTLLGEAYLYNTALSKDKINAGTWTFNTYCRADNNNRVSISRFVYRVIPDTVNTVTMTPLGSGTRTVTASGGTPFTTGGSGDGSATLTVGGYLQTPKGLYKISAVASATSCTILVPTTYTNESTVAFSVWKNLFGISTGTITNTTVGLYSLVKVESVQPEYTMSVTDKLGEIVFGVSTSSTTVYWTHNGTSAYSNMRTPLVVVHNQLAGVQGLASDEAYHLTLAKYNVVGNTTGTNSGDETAARVGAIVNGSTGKSAPDDTDLIAVTESSVVKKTTWAEVKTALNSATRTLTNKTLSTGCALDANASDNFTYHDMSRQAVIDGNFQICQLATTATNPASATYPVFDLWKYAVEADGGTLPTNIIVSQQIMTTGDLPKSYYFMRLNADGAGSSLGNGAVQYISHYIEHGTRYLCGLGKKVTFSFYAKSDIANKRLGLRAVQRYGTGGFPTSVEVINGTNWTLTSTWTKYTYTFTTNTLVGKTFGTNNDDYFSFDFWNVWGSTSQAGVGASTAESWVGSGSVDIAQLQVCAGDVALPFEPKSYREELRACQRYYEVCGAGNTGYWVDANNAKIYGTYQVHKRATPTCTLLTTSCVIEEVLVADRTATNATIADSSENTLKGFIVNVSGFSSATAKNMAVSRGNLFYASSRI